MQTPPITAVCIYHKGPYENLRESYNIILKYIEDNGYEIIDMLENAILMVAGIKIAVMNT